MGQSRVVGYVGYVAIVAAGIALLVTLAWGIVPGELGHHGAQIVPTEQPAPLAPAVSEVGAARATP